MCGCRSRHAPQGSAGKNMKSYMHTRKFSQHRATATQSLQFVLRNMHAGAALIYIDNCGSGSTEWITSAPKNVEAHKQG